jgi:hypothetical protein
VIIDASSAVKELVENALDAKATSIEIRLKEHGLESIQVSGKWYYLIKRQWYWNFSFGLSSCRFETFYFKISLF